MQLLNVFAGGWKRRGNGEGMGCGGGRG